MLLLVDHNCVLGVLLASLGVGQLLLEFKTFTVLYRRNLRGVDSIVFSYCGSKRKHESPLLLACDLGNPFRHQSFSVPGAELQPESYLAQLRSTAVRVLVN